MITYEHTVPTLLILLGILAGIGVGIFSFWRFMPRNRGNVLIGAGYLLFLALMAWCLFLPGKKHLETRVLKPRFIVGLDTSSSMLLSPAPDVQDRWTTARQALAMPWASIVAADCDIDLYTFSSAVSDKLPVSAAQTLEADGTSTLLRDGLKEMISRYTGLNVAGALLLSDGIDTREAFDDWAAGERPFPIYTLRLEPEAEWDEEPDLHVDSVNTPRRVTVGWQTELKTVVSGQGTKGQPVTIQLFKDGALAEEKPTQIPAGGGARETSFELDHPEVGVFQYRVVATPFPGESNTNDNEYVVSVQVIDAKNRLLYVEGPPRYEYKFLKRVLTANQEATPAIFYTGADGKPIGGVPVGSMTADMTEAQLAYFKIVVLGNLDADELSERRARNLVKFVESGGSLVLLGGSKGWGENGFLRTSLRDAMPVKKHATRSLEGKRAFPVDLTDAGRTHAAFAGDPELWDLIPPVLSVFPNVELSPGARALVEADTPTGPTPLVVTHRYGQGKVAAIFTDTLWKWQLTPESIENKPYPRFWTQLISWLLPSEQELDRQEIDLFADRDRLFLGETVEISARLGDGGEENKAMTCKLVLPDKREVPYAMNPQPVTTPSGRTYPGYAFRFTADTPGLYTAVAQMRAGTGTRESDAISFFVKPFTPESVPRPINAAVLKSIALGSGAQFFEDLQSMNHRLSALNSNPIEEQTAEYNTLWRTWGLVVLLMVILGATWAGRKLRNMP